MRAVRWDLRVRDRLLARPLNPCFDHAVTPDHREGTGVHLRRALPDGAVRRFRASQSSDASSSGSYSRRSVRIRYEYRGSSAAETPLCEERSRTAEFIFSGLIKMDTRHLPARRGKTLEVAPDLGGDQTGKH